MTPIENNNTPYGVTRKNVYGDVVEVLGGYDSEANSYQQDDYPYGRHRTLRRVWVETATKGSKKGQQRFMAQTKNPKTFRWNKPKASTYSHIIVIYLDPKGHVKLAHLSTWDDAAKVAAYVDQFGKYLTDDQQESVRYLDAVQRVNSRLTWTISDGNNETSEEREARKKAEMKTLNAMLCQELRSPSQTPILG